MNKNIFSARAAFMALLVFCGSAFSQYWTGEGGKGIRLAVLEPEGKGISKKDQWMLSLVQSSIAGDLNKYSDMTIIDRQNLEKVFEEWKESMSGNYSEENRIKIGNLTNASHILNGTISKTANAFMLELSVTDLKSGERKASYSPTPVSAFVLENLSAIKEASADLLKQLGVNLTSTALAELKKAANTARVQAEEALARGIVAKRQGTEVAALSYFYQAAALDPSLLEATGRSSVMAANISSGNIGADTRNDILWRRDWVARLKEAEQFFNNLFNKNSLPYTLFYSTKIIPGEINYQTETQTLSINTNLRAFGAGVWLSSVEKSLQAVYDGLDATKRKKDWKLENWPWSRVTDLRPFDKKRKAFSIVAELLNDKGTVIGRANFQSEGSWWFNGYGRPQISISDDDRKQVKFASVKADDITDRITIRIASVNGTDANAAARTGVLQVKAISEAEWDKYKYAAGLETDSRDGKEYIKIKIGKQIWMVDNLNYEASGSKCYENKPENCTKYGRLYDWKTAKNACPSGWHLPSKNEWEELDEAVGGKNVAGKKLKARNGWNGNGNGTDEYGFSALPGGYGNSGSSFSLVGDGGYWWSAGEDEDYSYSAYRRGMFYGYDYAGWYSYSKSSLFSVRCLQD
jgi:uncharacterized protein (TIGR02145 family)